MRNFYQEILTISNFRFSNIFEKKNFLNDVKNYKNISNFVFSTMTHAKAVNISDQYNQFI